MGVGARDESPRLEGMKRCDGWIALLRGADALRAKFTCGLARLHRRGQRRQETRHPVRAFVST